MLRFLGVVLPIFILACGSDNARLPDDSDADVSDATSGSDGSGGDQEARTDAMPVCSPGSTEACVGPGSCFGQHECNSTGSGWSECVCVPGPPDAGTGSPDASGSGCSSAADCNDGNPCTQDLCGSGGVCSNGSQPDGLFCLHPTTFADGRCRAGSCCTGCWDGSGCVTGTALHECGDEGSLCQDCDDYVFCTNDSCLPSGACGGHSNRPAGTPCPDGHCGSGGTAGMCVPDSPGTCGGAGQPCCSGFTCTQSGTTCNYDTNVCEYCGGEDELCCLVPGPAYVCDDEAHADCVSAPGGSNYCRCGGVGEACCNDVLSPCDAPLSCGGGVCT